MSSCQCKICKPTKVQRGRKRLPNWAPSFDEVWSMRLSPDAMATYITRLIEQVVTLQERVQKLESALKVAEDSAKSANGAADAALYVANYGGR